MYGAILGDIIGSPFEFDRGDKTKEFDLFSKSRILRFFGEKMMVESFNCIIFVVV